jgi:acetolactate synthase I/II/III large subunit
MKGYEAIAQCLLEEGTESVFTLLGNANMELLTHLGADGKCGIFHARHEGAVIAMSEGYAQASGRVACCSTTSGPGLVNGALSLVQAARSRTPMVLITGRPGDPAHHQWFPHDGLARLAGAGYEDVRTAEDGPAVVHRAFARARVERRPVVVDVNIDVQHRELDAPPACPDRRVAALRQRIAPDPEAVAVAATALGGFERPIIVAGLGALRSGGGGEVLALAEDTGALLATTLATRGWFDGHPCYIGVAGGYGWPSMRSLFAGADGIVAVGASLNEYTLSHGHLAPNATVVQIDIEPDRIMGTGRRADCYVQGDARTTVAALRAALAGSAARTATGYRTPEVVASIAAAAADVDPEAFPIEPGRVDPRPLLDAVDRGMPQQCGIAWGSGHCWGISSVQLRRWYEPQVFRHHFGAVGFALPMAAGAAIAQPDHPFLLVDGDGSLMMNVQVLETLAQYQLPVFVVVLNDNAFGAEFHQLRASGLPEDQALLPPTSIAAAAEALGCRSAVVRTVEEMEAATATFRADRRPFLVEVPMSRNVLSGAFRRTAR